MSSENFTCKGSCLCGKVTYEVVGPFTRFRMCHCPRCRKATSSAHASNIFTRADAIKWITGAQNMKRFDLPNATRFSKSFCVDCGSAMPYVSRDGTALVIPAGTLEDDPQIRPEANIFWPTRAQWYDEGLEAQRCDQYPQKNR